jgi:hypothetical protein
MQTIPRLCGVVVLLMVAASCGGGTADDAMQNEETPPAAALPVGTAGDQATAEEQVPTSTTAPADLPDTAGPMPFVGGVGILLVAGGIVLRRCNRSE